jgi:hypothetical protein
MPVSAQCVLSNSDGVELTKMAEIADQILDHSTQYEIMVTNPCSKSPTPSQQPTVNYLEERPANMEKQLSELATVKEYTNLVENIN